VGIIAASVLGILLLMFRVQQLSRRSSARKEKESIENIKQKKTLEDLEGILDQIKTKLNEPSTQTINDFYQARPTSETKLKEILLQADPKDLALFFSRETPQTIALMLYYLEPNRSAEILKEIPEKMRAEVIASVALLEDINPDVIDTLLKTTAETFGSSTYEHGMRLIESLKVASEMLKHLPESMQSSILSNIEKSNSSLSAKLKQAIKP
jgi:flagellar motor switch protein FliG